jgi:mono/diheme cytochrome c family protein
MEASRWANAVNPYGRHSPIPKATDAMTEWQFPRAISPVHCVLAVLVVAIQAGPAWAQDSFTGGRRVFLEKADCAYCHGWAGDGAGQGQSPGGAANLRRSQLNRDSLIMVISCGIPGRGMPHFDDQAYTDKRCYGMTEAEIGDKIPPFPPSTALPRRDVEIVADYLLAKVIGRGAITREECVEALGPRVRSCGEYPAAP